MRSKVLISLSIVFTMVVAAMIPLSIYDNGDVNADGEADEDGFFLISSVEELSMVGKGQDNPDGYKDWTLAASYKLANNIIFDPDNPAHDTNGGVKMRLQITYAADNFTVTVTSAEAAVSSLYVWIGLNVADNGGGSGSATIAAPSDAGKYTMTIGGELDSNDKFAYAIEIEVLSNMNGWSTITTDFDSNGNFDPIGEYISDIDHSKAFSGIFDGNGFKISGMNVAIFSSSDYVYAGLFAYVRGTASDDKAVIKSIGMTGGYSIGSAFTTVDVEVFTGGIVGYAHDVTIDNCYNTGNMTASASVTGGDAHIREGGIAGRAESSTIDNCYNTGNMTASASVTGGDAYIRAGGIAGRAVSSTIDNCYNTGNMAASASVTGDYLAGVQASGIANYASLITNCYNTGNMTVSTSASTANDNVSAHAGGISCGTNSSTIKNCYNTGNMTASTSATNGDSRANAGGIVSYPVSSTTENCYNTGNITASALNTNGRANAFAGGIVGFQGVSSTIENCYNTGNITASALNTNDQTNAYTGGIVGYQNGTTGITNCYNIGEIAATVNIGTNAYTGGILGFQGITANITDSYFFATAGVTQRIGNVSGVEGSMVTIDAMRISSNYNWDFDENDGWEIGIEHLNDGLPILRVFLFKLEVNIGDNGKVMFEGEEINSGTEVEIYSGIASVVTITPDPGNRYVIGSITDTGNDVTDQVPATGGDHILTNIVRDRVVTVNFILLYTIAVNTPPNGTVSVDNSVVTYGSSVTITMTPNNGFELSSVRVNGADVMKHVSNNKYVISSVETDYSIVVEFKAVTAPVPDDPAGDNDDPGVDMMMVVVIVLVMAAIICVAYVMLKKRS